MQDFRALTPQQFSHCRKIHYVDAY